MLLMAVAVGIPADGQAHIAPLAQVGDCGVLAGDLLLTRDTQTKADGIDKPAHAAGRNLAAHNPLNALKPLRAVLLRRVGSQGDRRLAVKKRRRRAHNSLAAAVAAAAVVVEHDPLHRLIPHFLPVSFSFTRMSV